MAHKHKLVTGMGFKIIQITAQSKIGWAPIGRKKPSHRGTISTIKMPTKTVQWFIGRPSSRGNSLDARNWFRIVEADCIGGKESIHDLMMGKLPRSGLSIMYEYESNGPQRIHK